MVRLTPHLHGNVLEESVDVDLRIRSVELREEGTGRKTVEVVEFHESLFKVALEELGREVAEDRPRELKQEALTLEDEAVPDAAASLKVQGLDICRQQPVDEVVFWLQSDRQKVPVDLGQLETQEHLKQLNVLDQLCFFFVFFFLKKKVVNT